MKKKFAFLIMGEHYDASVQHCTFETEHQITSVFTVNNFAAALAKVKNLVELEYGAIELCGAFGAEKTNQLIEATENKIPLGFVTYNPQQEALVDSFFHGFGEAEKN